MSAEKIDRRHFIKLFVAGTTLVVGPKIVREVGPAASDPPAETSGPSPRWAMVIDQARCVGCSECVLACKAANDIPPSMAWSRLADRNGPYGEGSFLPVQCMQCAHAPCVGACPVKATYYRADGIVMMDYDRCIGCRYCEMACPYGARVFNWEAFEGPNPLVPAWGTPEVARRPRGVVEKCDFCAHRITRGLALGLTPGVDREATPNCVINCPQGARAFGDLNDPESPVRRALAEHPSFRLREELGTEPRIYYLPPRDAAEETCS